MLNIPLQNHRWPKEELVYPSNDCVTHSSHEHFQANCESAFPAQILEPYVNGGTIGDTVYNVATSLPVIYADLAN